MTPIHVAALALMTVGSLLAVVNWFTLYQTWRSGRFCSAIPLFGAFLLGAGMLLLPSTRPFAWLAAILDYGTLILIVSLPRLVNEFWKTSRFNLLEEFRGERGNKTVRLRLFRNGVFTLEQHFIRPPGECGLTGASTCGTWAREQGLLVLSQGGDSSVFESVSGTNCQAICQTTGFRADDNGELSLADVKLKLQTTTAPGSATAAN
jgi:hypothetical protein